MAQITLNSSGVASNGTLALQSNGTTTAITVDTSQNVILNDTAKIGSSRFSMLVNPSIENAIAVKTSSNGDIAAFRVLSSDNNEQGAVNVNTSTQAMTFRTANTERARFNSTGALVLAGGSTSANGIGITFPATQSASSDANTLDDYEEGTLTTSFSSPVNLTGTPALGKGRYTKVGRLVSIQGEITGYSITTANTFTYFVMTLPFVTVSNIEAFSGSVTETNSYSVGTILDASSGSDNTIFLGFRAASVPSSGTATYHFSLTYMSA